MRNIVKSGYDWIMQNKKLSAVILINVLFLSFFLFFNFNRGYFVDDYGYMYNFSQSEKIIEDRVDSIAEVVQSQYEHYFIMNGRSMSHALLQFSLMLGKTAFNFINTLFYFLLSFGMYNLVRRKGEHNPLLQMIMYIIPWAVFPEYGNVFLVCCLSVNYMWTMAVIVNVMLPFRKLFEGSDCFEKRPLAGAVFMLIAGVFSGWQSENGSAALLFIIGCMGLYYLISRKRIPAWCITGFAGMCAGFLFMLLSPGYSIRKSNYAEHSYLSQFVKISVNNILPYFECILITALCLGCILYFRIKSEKKERIRFLCLSFAGAAACELLSLVIPESIRSEFRLLVLFAAISACIAAAVICAKAKVKLSDLTVPTALITTGFVATYAMIASPRVEARSEIQFLILFTCGASCVVIMFLKELSELLKFDKLNAAVLAAVVLYAIVSLSATAVRTDINYEQFIDREEYILEQKSAGIYDIQVEPYDIPEDRHIGMFNVVQNDPEYWINKGTCWYYGIDSIYYIVEE